MRIVDRAEAHPYFKNMPYGINYKQILNSLVVKPVRAVLFFVLCICLKFGFFYLNIVWNLDVVRY